MVRVRLQEETKYKGAVQRWEYHIARRIVLVEASRISKYRLHIIRKCSRPIGEEQIPRTTASASASASAAAAAAAM